MRGVGVGAIAGSRDMIGEDRRTKRGWSRIPERAIEIATAQRPALVAVRRIQGMGIGCPAGAIRGAIRRESIWSTSH